MSNGTYSIELRRKKKNTYWQNQIWKELEVDSETPLSSRGNICDDSGVQSIQSSDTPNSQDRSQGELSKSFCARREDKSEGNESKCNWVDGSSTV